MHSNVRRAGGSNHGCCCCRRRARCGEMIPTPTYLPTPLGRSPALAIGGAAQASNRKHAIPPTLYPLPIARSTLPFDTVFWGRIYEVRCQRIHVWWTRLGLPLYYYWLYFDLSYLAALSYHVHLSRPSFIWHLDRYTVFSSVRHAMRGMVRHASGRQKMLYFL